MVELKYKATCLMLLKISKQTFDEVQKYGVDWMVLKFKKIFRIKLFIKKIAS